MRQTAGMSPMEIGQVRTVLTGRVRPYTRPGSTSAIDKAPRTGAVAVGPLGLEGDEQADLRVHGGQDKAVHCYPWSHYAHWRTTLPAAASAVLRQPGAFGENFSMEGITEGEACIADRWQVGTALLEVSQGRQPCWKLNERFGVPDMARRLQESTRSGWYLRVLQPGEVRAGDAVRLLARPWPEWTLARLLGLIADRNCDPGVLAEVLRLPLPPSWQRLFARRLENGQVEDWTSRLQGARRD